MSRPPGVWGRNTTRQCRPGIGRDLEARAWLAELLVALIAVQNVSVGIQEGVQGYVDQGTCLVHFPIAAVALPSVPGIVHKSVGRALDGDT